MRRIGAKPGAGWTRLSNPFRRNSGNVISLGPTCGSWPNCAGNRPPAPREEAVMGYGEWVGNESIHWTVVHEDETGAPVALSSRQGNARHPKTGHDVHVERTCRGCDP